MWTSSAIPYISLFCHQQTHTVIFIFFPSVVNEMSHLFLRLKNIFCSFQLFEYCHIHNIVSTLINAVKLGIENNNIVWRLSNIVNINTEIGNTDSTLFGVVSFNIAIHNVLSTFIWHCPTLQCHITLTTTLRQCWNICWLLKNVAKRLHNFVKFIWKHTYLVEYLFSAAFVSFQKGICRIILVLKS